MSGNPAIQWSDAIEVAEWITSQIDPGRPWVRHYAPSTFAGYVRLTYWHEHGDDREPGPATREQVRVLTEVLRRTSPLFGSDADQCWFAVCDVYGWTGQISHPAAPLVQCSDDRDVTWHTDPTTAIDDIKSATSQDEASDQPDYPYRMAQTPWRSYMLYSGAVENALDVGAAGGPVAAPDLWWPQDRKWFVGSDTDILSAFVAGPERLIEQLVTEPRLDAVRVSLDDLV